MIYENEMINIMSFLSLTHITSLLFMIFIFKEKKY